MAEQNRGELKHFIAKSLDDDFVRLAKGISSLGNNLNPLEVTHSYIDDSSSTVTTGYQDEWPIDGNIYSEDAAADMLHEMAWNRAKGDDATIYMIVVMGWEKGKAEGSFKAYRIPCTWSPASDGGGEGGGDVTFSGSLKAKGDQVHGEVVITKATDTEPEIAVFTADETTAPEGGE